MHNTHIILEIHVVCHRKNSYPLNMGLLAAFTLCESCVVAAVCGNVCTG
jgi:hypothetical protein